MNSSLKVLTAILPAALLAGALDAGPAGAEPAGTSATAPSMPAAPSPATSQQTPAVAAAAAEGPFLATYRGHVTVRADRTATDLFTKRFKILAPVAIGFVSQQQETYVEGMEILETVEAYTEKADGTKIPVDPANIITRDAATGLQVTFTRDLKQRTVIFQDVAGRRHLGADPAERDPAWTVSRTVLLCRRVRAHAADGIGRDRGRGARFPRSPGQAIGAALNDRVEDVGGTRARCADTPSPCRSDPSRRWKPGRWRRSTSIRCC